MLKLLNTKILLAMLAAVLLIGAYMVHENSINQQAADAATKSAALLQKQQDAEDAAKKYNDELLEGIQKAQQKSNAMPTNGSNSNHYIP